MNKSKGGTVLDNSPSNCLEDRWNHLGQSAREQRVMPLPRQLFFATVKSAMLLLPFAKNSGVLTLQTPYAPRPAGNKKLDCSSSPKSAERTLLSRNWIIKGSSGCQALRLCLFYLFLLVKHSIGISAEVQDSTSGRNYNHHWQSALDKQVTIVRPAASNQV